MAVCAEVVVGSMVLAVIFSPWCCGSPPIGGPTAQRTRHATVIRTVAIGPGDLADASDLEAARADDGIPSSWR
jgi:hypothetical protein